MTVAVMDIRDMRMVVPDLGMGMDMGVIPCPVERGSARRVLVIVVEVVVPVAVLVHHRLVVMEVRVTLGDKQICSDGHRRESKIKHGFGWSSKEDERHCNAEKG